MAGEPDLREWLEVDGYGGFASGTISGIRTRRYHALLLTATRPPTGRVVLVNGCDVWVETPAASFPISAQRYPGNVIWPAGHEYLESFTTEPWPTWEFSLPGGTRIRQEVLIPRDVQGVALRWSVGGARQGVRLHVRPFFSGRDYHSLHHANSAFDFQSQRDGNRISWKPYGNLPAVIAEANAEFQPRADWYRNFVYTVEEARGMDFEEDLAVPGEFHFDLQDEDAVLLLSAERPFSQQLSAVEHSPLALWQRAADSERQRRAQCSPLEQAAQCYIAQRGAGSTIIAGFPWFTDWGRDTFIALRGLCISTGRLDIARQILLAWAGTVSQGMLPNRFPDQGDEPEFNSVDASLWYIIAVHDYLQAAEDVAADDLTKLQQAVESILRGYAQGTRFGIHLGEDGLIAAGEPGVQLTWMDAKVGDWVVTPRIGKPVEIQALWLNALWIATRFDTSWQKGFDRGRAAFHERFWNEEAGYLYDVVDADHEPGRVDDALRPNQVFAVGGLPLALLEGEQASAVVHAVEEHLLTPLGLRSLDPRHKDYQPHYTGDIRARDGAYHQGTVWPWLIGPFVEAWVRVRGSTPEAKVRARETFLPPLYAHLEQAGLGHISEIADGAAPHMPRGCPFQAWSLGELLRLERTVLRV